MATLFLTLLGGYKYILTNSRELGEVGGFAKRAIPIFGITSAFIVGRIDHRARALYGSLLNRGKRLEEILGLGKGHFHALFEVQTEWPHMTHTEAVQFFYFLVMCAWGYLFFKSIIP